MDNLQFGAFVAQLRKEQSMTQKDLAGRLNVTDKAVSKWETGKGFPDVKLLEPLAQALDVTLVELIQCHRSENQAITMEQAENVVSQAMDQSQKSTARHYLKLFRLMLAGISALCLLSLFPYFLLSAYSWYVDFVLPKQADIGIIGGADGPTAILISSSQPPSWLAAGILAPILIFCVILFFRVRSAEKKLK